MSEIKNEYLKIARELHYPKTVQAKIKLAQSENEITRIMINARLGVK